MEGSTYALTSPPQQDIPGSQSHEHLHDARKQLSIDSPPLEFNQGFPPAARAEMGTSGIQVKRTYFIRDYYRPRVHFFNRSISHLIGSTHPDSESAPGTCTTPAPCASDVLRVPTLSITHRGKRDAEETGSICSVPSPWKSSPRAPRERCT